MSKRSTNGAFGYTVVLHTDNDSVEIPPFDQDTVKRAAEGDTKAFSQLFFNTYRYSFSIIRKILNNDQDIYDALQDTYMKVYANLSRLKDYDAFLPWLAKIAQNSSKDIIAKTSNSTDTLPEDDDTVDGFNREVIMDFTEVFSKLSPDDAELLTLVYYDGLKVSDIAKMKSLAATTVYSRVNAAKRRLKDLLKLKGIDKPIYGGNLIALITAVLRNAIGSQVLSAAVADEILQSVLKKDSKAGVVMSRVLKKQRNDAVIRIASLIAVFVVFVTLVTLGAYFLITNKIRLNQGKDTVGLNSEITSSQHSGSSIGTSSENLSIKPSDNSYFNSLGSSSNTSSDGNSSQTTVSNGNSGEIGGTDDPNEVSRPTGSTPSNPNSTSSSKPSSTTNTSSRPGTSSSSATSSKPSTSSSSATSSKPSTSSSSATSSKPSTSSSSATSSKPSTSSSSATSSKPSTSSTASTGSSGSTISKYNIYMPYYGNLGTAGNMAYNTTYHGGTIAKQGDWLYYSFFNSTHYTGLCKVKTDGTGKTVLADVYGARYINVVGDWVYYIDCGTSIYGNKVVRIKTDGTEKEVFFSSDKQYYGLQVFGGEGYIMKGTNDADATYFIVDMSSGENAVTAQDILDCLDRGAIAIASEDYLIYSHDNDLYAYNRKTAVAKKLFAAKSCIFHNNKLWTSTHYADLTDFDNIVIQTRDGKKMVYFDPVNEKVYSTTPSASAYDYATFGDGYVYYTKWDGLYRANIDGSNPVRLVELEL